MMSKIPVSALLSDFQRMYQEHWDYVAGGSSERQVDCSGAFVWAFRQHGCKIYHGSNRIARTEVVELIPIKEAHIVPGMAAFKSRAPGLFSSYSLPESYRLNGSYYNGDVNDYYHIGLVAEDTSQVLNAQSAKTGFVSSDISKGGWAYVAYLKQVDYGETVQSIEDGQAEEGQERQSAPPPVADAGARKPSEATSAASDSADARLCRTVTDRKAHLNGSATETPSPSATVREPDILRAAKVIATSGGTVKLRQKPSKSCNLYWDVPVGAEVLVRGAEQGGWTPVTWGNRTGYMMSQFLTTSPAAEAAEANWAAEIDGLTREQAEALQREYPSASIFETHG